jgi:hypothetical protein
MSNGISTDSTDPYDNSQPSIHDNPSHNYPNSHHHVYNSSLNTQSHPNASAPTIPMAKMPKARKKRKPNEPNTSFEDDVPAKARKRKSKLSIILHLKLHPIISLEKGADETEKFVEHSLQQLRDLPMLTPMEPAIDINNELSLPLPFNLSEKKSSFQGEFGDIFIENIPDCYRPNRRPPVKPLSLTLGMSSFSSTKKKLISIFVIF